MRLQKLAVMTALAGFIGSANVYALGLGEVKLFSSLNQPLKAEIELLQAKELSKHEVLPNLASRPDFERAGIDRPYSLTDLEFKTTVNPATGKMMISITSDKPVQEPYLNFLMEVHWPSGRLLREYTLLLDPPAFSEQPSSPVRTPVSKDYEPYRADTEVPAGTGYLPVPEGMDQSEPRETRKLSPDSAETTYRPEPSSRSTDNYTVQRNDTLWEIASRMRPGNDLSVQQTMLAIQRENPEAFMDNNINRLKRGEILRMPERSEIQRVGQRDAIVQVARQNRSWYESRQGRVAQLDATRRTAVKPEAPANIQDGKLAIVTPDSSTGRGQDMGGSQSGSNNTALQNELAMTREQLDKLTRENTELKSRLKDLDDQIATLKRLATLKDDRMAALQTQMAEAEQQRQKELQQLAQAQNQPQPEPSQPTIMDVLFGNPLLLLLLALFPAGALGWLLYRRRKDQQEQLLDEADAVASAPVDLGLAPASEKKTTVKGISDDLTLDEALEIDETLLKKEPEATEEVAQETEDAISEADIYIAYGRFNQAIDILQDSITAEPQRSDLRLKLLEVFAESNELDKFKETLAGLEQLGDAEALSKAEAYKARFPGESFENVGSGTADNAVDDLADLELDLDFDDDLENDLDAADLDLEEDLPPPPPPPPPPAADDLELSDNELPDLDLDDFDLDLDDEDNLGISEDTSAAFSDEGGSSLEAAINDDDLDFLSEDDEVSTKLDLARAYIDMGDMDGARDILQEVLEQGSDEQKTDAQALLDQVG